MNRLLTVAIPTHNRASLLDRQLAWFARAVKGREQDCELIISDNASSDETPQVIAKWRSELSSAALRLHTHRSSENVGAIRNIAFGINQAQGTFVWTVSDDDTVFDHSLCFVLDTIGKHPDLQSLVLNFSHRDCDTGEIVFSRCFETDEDRVSNPGKPVFEWGLSHPDSGRWGGLVLTTAQVYQTASAKEALKAWPEGLDNLYLQFFVTACCAMKGKTILTRDNFLEMAGGRHFFMGNKRLRFHFRMAEMPESLAQVARLGYSRALCLEKVSEQRRRIRFRAILRYLLLEPFTTLRLLYRRRIALRRIKKPPRLKLSHSGGVVPVYQAVD